MGSFTMGVVGVFAIDNLIRDGIATSKLLLNFSTLLWYPPMQVRSEPNAAWPTQGSSGGGSGGRGPVVDILDGGLWGRMQGCLRTKGLSELRQTYALMSPDRWQVRDKCASERIYLHVVIVNISSSK